MLSAVKIPHHLWEYRELIGELIKREISQRYRGSFLGVIWSIILPLIMLLIYTFVFSFVFKSRWQANGLDTPPDQFALILFAGLTPFTVFSEVANRAPTLILSVPNYVKKVVFPLEILPVVSIGVALFNSIIYVILLLIGNLLVSQTISDTIWLLPLAYLPLVLLCLGVSWFLSSISTYVRDVGQVIGVFVQMLFFLSPIFYSTSAVPAFFQNIFMLNPLVIIIDSFRQALLWGGPFDWARWFIWTVICALFAVFSYLWFIKLKKGFADVL